MLEVAVTNDGKVVTLLSYRDFKELIERYIGFDFAKIYCNQIYELSGCVKDLMNYVDDPDICSEIKEVLAANGVQ